MTDSPTEISRQQFFQFLFWRQWASLRGYAAEKGVHTIGDAPIFVAPDSADVWAHPELFQLGSDRRPLAVAGVPPDYFSPTGQLWGNPLYNWDAHTESGYTWWIQRIQAMLSLVDIIRIDHFRGFVDYWQIPAGAETAVNGQWLDGPGIGFFEAVLQALGSLPMIAEDLGELNPAVPALRDQLGLPGIKVVQFAFDGTPDNPFLPHTYPENCVAYSGTHDNNTTIGWFQAASAEERARAMAYLGSDGTDIAGDVIIGRVGVGRQPCHRPSSGLAPPRCGGAHEHSGETDRELVVADEVPPGCRIGRGRTRPEHEDRAVERRPRAGGQLTTSSQPRNTGSRPRRGR